MLYRAKIQNAKGGLHGYVQGYSTVKVNYRNIIMQYMQELTPCSLNFCIDMYVLYTFTKIMQLRAMNYFT